MGERGKMGQTVLVKGRGRRAGDTQDDVLFR